MFLLANSYKTLEAGVREGRGEMYFMFSWQIKNFITKVTTFQILPIKQKICYKNLYLKTQSFVVFPDLGTVRSSNGEQL